MDKDTLIAKIKELEELKKKIEAKRKEVDGQLLILRPQLYKIIEEENRISKESEKNAPPPDVSFLNDMDWGDINIVEK